jgi:hypothetical protein
MCSGSVRLSGQRVSAAPAKPLPCKGFLLVCVHCCSTPIPPSLIFSPSDRISEFFGVLSSYSVRPSICTNKFLRFGPCILVCQECARFIPRGCNRPLQGPRTAFLGLFTARPLLARRIFSPLISFCPNDRTCRNFFQRVVARGFGLLSPGFRRRSYRCAFVLRCCLQEKARTLRLWRLDSTSSPVSCGCMFTPTTSLQPYLLHPTTSNAVWPSLCASISPRTSNQPFGRRSSLGESWPTLCRV